MPFYPHKFQPGDTVTIRAWDDMLSQYGSLVKRGIKLPYLTFDDNMKQFCGRSFKVEYVRPSINDKYWIYGLDGSWLLLRKICSFLPHLFLLLPFPSMIL